MTSSCFRCGRRALSGRTPGPAGPRGWQSPSSSAHNQLLLVPLAPTLVHPAGQGTVLGGEPRVSVPGVGTNSLLVDSQPGCGRARGLDSQGWEEGSEHLRGPAGSARPAATALAGATPGPPGAKLRGQHHPNNSLESSASCRGAGRRLAGSARHRHRAWLSPGVRHAEQFTQGPSWAGPANVRSGQREAHASRRCCRPGSRGCVLVDAQLTFLQGPCRDGVGTMWGRGPRYLGVALCSGVCAWEAAFILFPLALPHRPPLPLRKGLGVHLLRAPQSLPPRHRHTQEAALGRKGLLSQRPGGQVGAALCPQRSPWARDICATTVSGILS